MSDPTNVATALRAVDAIAQRAGVTLSAADLQAAAELVLGVIDLATGVSLKRAAAAGRAAAAQVTTVQEANAVLEAAAAAQESK